jgi:DNA-binding NtrC family response regulator
MVRKGTFREDLSYRLRVVTIALPPLRERLADLPRLAKHFLDEAAKRHGKPARTIAPETMDILSRYAWPGNVRELRNALEAMVLMSRSSVLTPETVPSYVRPAREGPELYSTLSSLPLEEVERALVTNTLRDVGGNRERASQLLGISTRTLYRKIKEYGLARRPDEVESTRTPDATVPIRHGG